MNKSNTLNLGDDHWFKAVEPNDDYPNKFNLDCIDTIEKLNNTLSAFKKEDGSYPLMGFDTETNGLNPETCSIVGYSFAFDEESAWYVPVNHIMFGLGKESLRIIYEVMTKAFLVLMYNARFDIRMMEWQDFETEDIEFKKDFITKNKPYYAYDMSKVNVYDIQVLVWSTYTKKYMPKLKAAESHFLGWRSTTFQETLATNKKNKKEVKDEATKVTTNIVQNFAYLNPFDFDTYAYAATDALALILLYNKLKWARDEGGTSVQMHSNLKMIPLTRFEQTPIAFDSTLARRQSRYFHDKLKTTESRIYNIVGEKFNISSAGERANAFKKANIVLTEKTDKGAYATGVAVLDKVKQQFDKDSEQYILIDLCSEYLHLQKMLSTYIDSMVDQISEHPYRADYFRYSYRNTSTTSGRYSGGLFESKS